jgi:hypothetical protein
MYFRFHYGCTSVNSFFITCVLIVFRVIALGLVVLGLTWTLLRLLYTRGPICVVVLCTYFVSSDFEVGVYSVAWLIALCGGCTYVLRYMNMHGHGHAQSMEKYRVARTRYTFFFAWCTRYTCTCTVNQSTVVQGSITSRHTRTPAKKYLQSRARTHGNITSVVARAARPM